MLCLENWAQDTGFDCSNKPFFIKIGTQKQEVKTDEEWRGVDIKDKHKREGQRRAKVKKNRKKRNISLNESLLAVSVSQVRWGWEFCPRPSILPLYLFPLFSPSLCLRMCVCVFVKGRVFEGEVGLMGKH